MTHPKDSDDRLISHVKRTHLPNIVITHTQVELISYVMSLPHTVGHLRGVCGRKRGGKC